MEKLFFIHIPKTAGTSLRVSLQNALGDAAIHADYGLDAPQTSEAVKTWLLGEQADPYRFLHVPNLKVLTGHVSARKYASMFAISNIFTLVREPIERVISEYHHFQRHHDFQGSLLDFAHQSHKQNTLQRYLRGVPWQAMGYVGTSTNFQQVTDDLAHIYNLALEPQVLNAKPQEQNESVPDDVISELIQLNENDIELYKRIDEAMQWRQHCKERHLEYVHGRTRFNREKKILSGFAFYHPCENVQSAVQLSVQLLDSEGSIVDTIDVNACLFEQPLAPFHPPRNGYVGFQIDLRQYAAVKTSERVEVVAVSSGQKIGSHRL
ncbi:MAG: sulfotransferase family protein [Aliidiomarina sp.]|uniref:sulfotransferase family 2 domain-containing protein n=1 Tax=Aliidiomarina sp. TaxID=1872439 RepID=UPI0025C59526|nr:sulfotransferase family 2 domain-containing protein [Aliidiomarina sp.]MCH8502454.1 sulfotransferase family protein [Aliidiomarina sp.]